ncbi:MAG: dihydrolipoyl dehydrogenase [Sulfurimonas sp.]|uniref:dihydrolipoyl dehydrogenase n=1 Tax=Sulfurimonas sp. TaxID=2022749 RepID=UPI003D138D69
MREIDTVIIGAGPAGYEAALHLANSGVDTLLIEHSKVKIGGVCLNEGCIPTKNYLQSSSFASKIPYFKSCGLELEYNGFDLKQLVQKTIALKDELRSGVVWMLDQAKVEILYGTALFRDSNHLELSGEVIAFKKCIIATGSQVLQVPKLPLDGKYIISSSDIFNLQTMPSSITIVGGGAIGCEFATFFSAFGVDVTMVVRGLRLLTREDEEVSKALLRAFKKRSIKVLTSAEISNVEVDESGAKLLVATPEGEKTLNSELLLCAIGRIPRSKELQLEKAGVKCDKRGFVEVNEALQTTQKHIYAAGDCINTPGFAHTAYTEGRIAAQNSVKGDSLTNSHVTPFTIFCDPQIASCGLNEQEAKEQGIEVEVKKAYFKANAKAKISGDDSGFVKIVISSQSGEILGASIIGAEATEIIHEFIIAIEKKIPHNEFVKMIFAHPTLCEIVRYLI